MRKKTITIRVKKSQYEKIKEEAKNKGQSISEFLNQVVSVFKNTDNIKLERKKVRSSNLQKINVYMPEQDVKEIKKKAAELETSESYLFRSALLHYFEEKKKISKKPQPTEGNLTLQEVMGSYKTVMINFYINSSINKELDLYAIENDKTRTNVILEAIEALNEADINIVNYRGFMDKQSSFIADEAFKIRLTSKAKKLDLSNSDFINRALHLYLNMQNR